MARIVSLLASATEVVYAVGCGADLVGRSHECDHPPQVADLPGSSRDVDQRVRDLVERGLAIYQVDAERLRALQPDVIITQVQCEVCAVSLAEVERAVADWLGAAPRIVALNPIRLGPAGTGCPN
jgi:iron complex transport system substrate-binding protein